MWNIKEKIIKERFIISEANLVDDIEENIKRHMYRLF